MPKISAPTVVEHRAQRLHALLEAARELVAAGGPDALTLAALAQQVGLSRPSLYEYFRSRDDLVAAIVEDEIPRWRAELAAALDPDSPPRQRVADYIAGQIRMMTDGRHAAAVALSGHVLGSDARERVRAEHERLLAPLIEALSDAGVPRPELRARLIQGIVTAASARTDGDLAALIESATAQAVDGIATGR